MKKVLISLALCVITSLSFLLGMADAKTAAKVPALKIPKAAFTQSTEQYFENKYGIFPPYSSTGYSMDPQKEASLKKMTAHVISTINKYNSTYHWGSDKAADAEIAVWWSYAEDINGATTYGNCNGELPELEFSYIYNCNLRGGLWQIGYGNQFAILGNLINGNTTPLLEQAFIDTHTDPNDATAVQKVGNNVLLADKRNGAYPSHCTGNTAASCDFPKMTVAQILAGYNPTSQTTNNWYAFVLARDPFINAYLVEDATRPAYLTRWIAATWAPSYRDGWGTMSYEFWTINAYWQELGGQYPPTSACEEQGDSCVSSADQCPAVEAIGDNVTRYNVTLIKGEGCFSAQPYCCNRTVKPATVKVKPSCANNGGYCTTQSSLNKLNASARQGECSRGTSNLYDCSAGTVCCLQNTSLNPTTTDNTPDTTNKKLLDSNGDPKPKSSNISLPAHGGNSTMRVKNT